jgi:preprotein translocase subunit SecF
VKFGVTALVALVHDVIVVVGIFAILGTFVGLEIDALFVTAMLTVIGFSVHDTIVVFDRIRENRIRHAGEPFGAIVNHSILQTLGRSISTSLTVIVTLTALLLLGPASIRTFTLALLHDVITVTGIFALMGYLRGWHVDSLFVTAMLTVIGFSVHDTIVVFDRIRENRIRHAGEPFGAIVNHSILQTLGRSISTSLTVVVTLTALLLLGPASIRTFTLALLIGVVSGTYSSIFNASQLLVSWYEWDANRKARPAGTGRAVKPLSR